MLTIYRRHSEDCQHVGKPRNARGARGCACPIWPEVPSSPTLPFTRAEMKKILAGCDEFLIKGIYGEGNRKRLKAMILLLRHTGLRIRDAVTITWDRIQNERVFLYTQKTGTPVHVPVPPVVTAALAEVKTIHEEYVFWTGAGDPKSAVADWQRSFRRLLDIVGVKGHFHMLRDTAAVEWLLAGVPLETVSVLLGHTDVRTTLDHYRPWVRALQQKLEDEVRKSWDEEAAGEKRPPARGRRTGDRATGVAVGAAESSTTATAHAAR